MKHPKWIRVISSFIAVLLLVSTFSQTVFAVEGDGTHIGHTGGGSSVSGAYLVPSSNDDHLVGYRFSWLTLGSDGYYARKSALDVFYNGYNPNSSWGYHIKATVNGNTYRNLSKYEYKRWFDSVKIEREYYSTSSAYKYCNRTDIPVVLPADEDAMTTWGLQDGNINKILNKMQSGATVANMKSSDFVFIEPIYRVKIEGTNYCITVTEMGLIGCVVCSKTSTGNEGSGYGSGWVTIRRYTNLNWPDALKTDSAHAGISAGTTLSSATSFQNLVNKGYGLMVIWNRNPHLLSVYYTTGTGDASLKIGSSYKLASDFTSYSSSYIRNAENNYFTQSVYYDNNLTLMNGAGSGFKMTRDYYDFFKWKKDGTSQLFSGGTTYKASSLESTVSTGDRSITLTAEWTPKPYKITYNLNGGKIGSSTTNPTQNYNYETDVYIGNYSSGATAYATPTRDGYDFGSWKYTGTTLGYWSNNSVYPNKYHKGQWEHGDITLYAQWVKKTYTVTYNANGGTGAPGAQTKNYGVDLTLSSGIPTRTGYDFISWNTKADGTGTTYKPSAKYTANANLVLYAQWKLKTYSVSYNANGGSGAPTSQTKTHGVDLTLASGKPTRDGYNFVSWNTKADGKGTTYQPSAKYTTNANLTLYAQWSKKTYTVTYNANGGSGAPASQTKTHGVDLTLASGIPTRTGNDFVSWNTKADGKGTTYKPGAKYTANANLTLYAQWKLKTYTISYNANGGSGAPASQTKTHNVDLTLASGKPTRDGYNFVSWNTKADGKGTTYQPSAKYTANANLTLYAQWAKKTYTVTYNANGGSGAPASQTKTHGVDLTLASGLPTRTGYDFMSWNTKADGKGTTYKPSAKYTANANLTLYAQWAKKTYTVTYNANGGSGAPASQTKTHGVALSLASGKPTRDGYNFVSWNTKVDGKGTTYQPSAKYTANANLTLYAQWAKKTYTVTYNANGGSGAPASQTKTHGVDLTLASGIPTRTGYDFVSWNTKADGTGTTFKSSAKYTSNANLVLYAQWKLKTYTVSYNANGGSGAPASQTKTHGVDLTLASGKPTRDGYNFVSWNTKADGKGTIYQPGARYTTNANLTLYAQWKLKSYTVTYNANGGTGAPASQAKTHGVDLTLASGLPARTGYDFVSWNTKADGKGTTYKPSAKYTANADLTLYAQWKLKTYTITYDANGGKSAPAAQIKKHGVDLTLASGKPTRDGYDFVSWNTKVDGKGTTYQPSGKYATDANLTLYAQWKLQSYTVTYNANGGTGAPGAQTKTYNVDLMLSSVKPTRTGYGFVGWNTNANGSGTSYAVGARYTKNENLTLYAQWQLNAYTVSYNANGGKGAPADHTKKHGTDLTLSAIKPTREGYSFVSWNTKSDGKGTAYSSGGKYTGNADLQLYAIWNPIQYTVKFIGNGATGGTMSNQTHTYDRELALTANAYKREFIVTCNYGNGSANTTAKATAAFGGWAKTATGSKAYDNQQKVKNLTAKSGDVISLYAKWTDGSVTLPAPTRTGYTFGGWYTSASSGTKIGDGGAKYTPSKDITIYARWTPITFSVRFNGNGNTSGTMKDQSFTYDKEQALTANAYKREFTVTFNFNGNGSSNSTAKAAAAFGGWAKTATGTKVYDNQQKLKNLTTKGGDVISLYAKWTDGSVMLPTPTRTGYTFSGWFTASSSGTKVGDGGGKYTPSKNTTVYAQWSPITYSVRFNGNGSTSGTMLDQSFTYDAEQALNANAYKREFTVTYNYGNGSANTTVKATATFGGWAKTVAGTKAYDNRQKIKNLTAKNGDVISLYAKWTDASVTLPTPTRTGYTFNGWYTSGFSGTKIGAAGAKYTPTKDITLFAQWMPIKYSVKYNGNGSTSGTMSNQSFTYDVEQALTANAYKRIFNVTYNYGNGSANSSEKANAVFSGWAKTSTGAKEYNNQQKVKNLSAKSGDIVNLYALWNDAVMTLPSPTKTGYRLTGWFTSSSGGTKVGDGGGKYTPAKDVTLYAQWTPVTYTVRFNGNGATSGTMADQSFTYDKSQNLTANAYKRTFTVTFAYGNGASNTTAKATSTFGGWAKTATGAKAYGDQQSVKNLSAIHGDVINLFARWSDASVPLPNPTRTGYTFTGWYTDTTGGTKIGEGGGSFTPSGNITVYGRWTPISYTVVFNGNGSTGGSTASMSVKYDETKALTANGFTRTGYQFVSWNTKADGTGTPYSDKQTIRNLSAVNGAKITLYAVWQPAYSLSIEMIQPNAAYREGTDVVSSFYLVNQGGSGVTPAENISVIFKVYRGSTVIKTVTLSKVVVPANEKNLLYFKWSVPSSLGSDKLYISAEISEAGESYGLIKNMYVSCKYEVSATPDTQFEISAPEGYTVPAAPSSNNTAKKWTEWVYENGAFKQVTYGIGISDAAVSVVPDASANAEKKNGVWIMKSGYSVSLSVDNGTKTVNGCTAPDSPAYTNAQYAAALFPEFGYLNTNGNYRTLELVSSKWQFRQNADYGRLHFTPLWFPDGPYTVSVVISDLWTPAGMLTRTANANTITIDGSAYDDWSIG